MQRCLADNNQLMLRYLCTQQSEKRPSMKQRPQRTIERVRQISKARRVFARPRHLPKRRLHHALQLGEGQAAEHNDMGVLGASESCVVRMQLRAHIKACKNVCVLMPQTST